MNFNRLNDGTQNAPRLRIQHSLWSLRGLPMNCELDNVPEWTLDEKFARARESGFEAMECWLNREDESEVSEALKRHDLKLVLGHRPFSLGDVRETVERATRLNAEFVFAQPANAFTPLHEVVEIVREGRKIANDAGLAFFVETHRNNFTENLPQTLQLIEAVPEIRFTGDFSHFVVVGEFYGWEAEGAIDRMRPVLERVSHLHARPSNGEQVQVDVGDGSGQTAQFCVEIWATCMTAWLRAATPGDIMPFTSELGPPRYAITLPDGREFSDRWTQSLVMKQLGEQAWHKARKEAGL